jgi:hypothetical protein
MMKTIQTKKYEIQIKPKQDNKPVAAGRDGGMASTPPASAPAGSGR